MMVFIPWCLGTALYAGLLRREGPSIFLFAAWFALPVLLATRVLRIWAPPALDTGTLWGALGETAWDLVMVPIIMATIHTRLRGLAVLAAVLLLLPGLALVTILHRHPGTPETIHLIAGTISFLGMIFLLTVLVFGWEVGYFFWSRIWSRI